MPLPPRAPRAHRSRDLPGRSTPARPRRRRGRRRHRNRGAPSARRGLLPCRSVSRRSRAGILPPLPRSPPVAARWCPSRPRGSRRSSSACADRRARRPPPSSRAPPRQPGAPSLPGRRCAFFPAPLAAWGRPTWTGLDALPLLPSASFLRLTSSFPDLPVAAYDESGAGQFAQAHRAVRVELAGGHTDLGAETQLPAVVEARRCAPHNAARVHLAEAPVRQLSVPRADRLGVPGSITGDMAYCRVDPVHHRDGELQVEELLPEVVRGGRDRGIAEHFQRPLVGSKLDVPLA